MARFEKIVHVFTRLLNWIAATALVAVMLFVCANVLGRAAFSLPVKGTFDIVSYLGVFVLAWALAYTQVQKGNIDIEILVIRLSPRTQAIIDSITFFISFALFTVISWQTTKYAILCWTVGERSEVLKLSSTPFVSAVALGCMALSLVLLIDFVKSFARAVKK